jgi:TatD DNase family protein
LIDSHCHLDCAAFAEDQAAVLERAAVRGVSTIVVPAVDEASWTQIQALEAASKSVRCVSALGIHPVALPAMDPAVDRHVLARLREALATTKAVAVGECGLDTTIDLNAVPLSRQAEMLAGQLEIARELDLPVVLHARGPGCYAALLEHLKADSLPAAGGVLHSYGGGVDLLKEFLRFPLMFGFAGPATYTNARKVRASIEAVPDERLLAETDAPDQTPEPHRPGRSEPAFVADVIAGIAAARQASPDVIARLTADNARRLFKLA